MIPDDRDVGVIESRRGWAGARYRSFVGRQDTVQPSQHVGAGFNDRGYLANITYHEIRERDHKPQSTLATGGIRTAKVEARARSTTQTRGIQINIPARRRQWNFEMKASRKIRENFSRFESPIIFFFFEKAPPKLLKREVERTRFNPWKVSKFRAQKGYPSLAVVET